MAILSFQGEHRFLSNFYPSRVRIGQVVYPTVENAYQAAKAIDEKHVFMFTKIKPGRAKSLGRSLRMRPDWEDVKLDVMKGLLEQKFQIPDLRGKLLATEGHTLQEGNCWGDTFWGVCWGVGENHLGRLLMEVRQAIQTELRKGE